MVHPRQETGTLNLHGLKQRHGGSYSPEITGHHHTLREQQYYLLPTMQDFELTNTAILNSLEELFPATKEVIRKDYPPTLEDDAPEYGDRHSFDTVKITNFSNEMLKQKPEMTYASGSKVSVAKGEQYYLLSEDGLEKVKENYSERHHDLRDGRSSGSGETLLEACHRTETIPEYVLEIKRGIHGRHNTHGRNLFIHRVHDMHRDEIERSLDAMEEAAEEALT